MRSAKWGSEEPTSPTHQNKTSKGSLFVHASRNTFLGYIHVAIYLLATSGNPEIRKGYPFGREKYITSLKQKTNKKATTPTNIKDLKSRRNQIHPKKLNKCISENLKITIVYVGPRCDFTFVTNQTSKAYFIKIFLVMKI